MRRRLCLVLLTCSLLLAGCWSRREVNDLGAVISLGIDRTPTGKLDLTLAIAQAGAAPSGKGQQGPARRSRVILQREGVSMSQATRLAQLASPRRLVLDHTQIVVFGERFAEQGVDDLLDFLLRNPQIRLGTQTMLVRGATPFELLSAAPLMRATQAESLRELESTRAGLSISLKDFFIARAAPHISPILPTVLLQPHLADEGAASVEVQLDGAAIFKDDRVTLYLDAEERRAAAWLLTDARDTRVEAPCPKYPEKFMSVRITRAERQIKPVWDGRQLSFDVNLEAHGHVVDLPCFLPISSPDELGQIQGAVVRTLSAQIEHVLRKTQASEVDPFGFGESVRAKMPDLWRRVGEEHWFKTWSAAPVRVTTKIGVVHINMTSEPPAYKPPSGAE